MTMTLPLSKILQLANAINLLEAPHGENGQARHLRLTPRGAFRLARNRRHLFEAVEHARAAVEKVVAGTPDDEVANARARASEEIGKEEVAVALEAIPVSWVETLPDHPALLSLLAALDGTVFCAADNE